MLNHLNRTRCPQKLINMASRGIYSKEMGRDALVGETKQLLDFDYVEYIEPHVKGDIFVDPKMIQKV